MKRNIDLLGENILTSLTGLALPVVATSLVQTVCNLTDMAWIGMMGSDAVAAIGAAVVYTWLSSDVAALTRMQGQVKPVYACGKGNRREAVQYGKGALRLAPVLVAAYEIIVNPFAGPLVGFFHLNSPSVVKDTIMYLRTACGPIPFAFIRQTLTGLYTASNNGRAPFAANCIGMGTNTVLDPLFTFGLGSIHSTGVAGTTAATVAAQFTMSLVPVVSMGKDPVLATQVRIWIPTSLPNAKTMVRIGFPAAIQSMLCCGMSIILTGFVIAQGDTAVAVQKVGEQIKPISWMTAGDFGTAINAFIEQSYGVRNLKRVKKGYITTSAIMSIWGIFTTRLLIFGAAPIFSLFIHELEVVPAGADYLHIIRFPGMFMCVELMAVGVLSDMGKIMEASVMTIILTAARIPLAVMLGGTALDLNGIWWALTISNIVKGITFFGYYLRIMRRMKA